MIGRERDELQDLTTGIDEIDGQHREFLAHLRSLREALLSGVGGRERLMRTFRYLDEFVVRHFDTEERYMRRHNYPGILLHQKEHAQFARTFEELKQKVLDLDARGEITAFLAIEVEHRLEKWLADHILLVDRKMADFLTERM